MHFMYLCNELLTASPLITGSIISIILSPAIEKRNTLSIRCNIVEYFMDYADIISDIQITRSASLKVPILLSFPRILETS